MMRNLVRWLSGRAAQARPAVVYGLSMAGSAALAMAALLALQWWAADAELSARAQWLARQLAAELAPAGAALPRAGAVAIDAPACLSARAALASLVQQTPHARYAIRRLPDGRWCGSDQARSDALSGERPLEWARSGAGAATLVLRGGMAALELETGWLRALLSQAREAGVDLQVRLEGGRLSADGAIVPAGGHPGEAAFPVANLAADMAVAGSVDVWAFASRSWAASLEALLLSLLAGGMLAAWLLRGAGVRNASDWEILEGIRHQEFFAHYQPIVTAASGECVGVEMLARWRHPVQGNVRSDLFIQTAIDAGLIVPLTRYLLKRVAGELRQVVLPPGFMVGINIASEHLAMPELVNDCREMLDMLNEKQAVLVLEVSEQTPLREASGALEVIRELRLLGVKLALDDFGAGYANKAYLQRWGFDYLKVEKGFVSALGQECLRGNVLDGLPLSSEAMGVRVIVKGVETQGQQSYLNVQGFELLQGFYFGKPMTLNHFRQWLYSGIVEDRRHAQRRSSTGRRASYRGGG
ncbi:MULTISPECIES: EAL domain-containing protein [Chromobacterium]|nr:MULTISPECIES: EAL domain-containing protein [Chromobacterium]WSE93538.1 EAL domain-containing protein [Chromobacterium subtsugae]